MQFNPNIQILGIVNVTEDSFSDGGKYLAPEKAIAHAKKLIEDGADIIDIGPSATSPNAKQNTAKEEIARLKPIIEACQKENIKISIDSYLSETQLYGIEKKVDFLNDIHGFSDPSIYEKLAACDCKLIVMHMFQGDGIATIEETKPAAILDNIYRFFQKRLSELSAAGIDHSQIIIDPGMGFFLGSNPETSILALQNCAKIKSEFDLPMLVSVSRKSFIRNITICDTGNSGSGTLAAELFCAMQGVDYIRTHEAKQLRDGLRVFGALSSVGWISTEGA